MYRAFLLAILFAFLILNGLVHGLWTDRWSVDHDAEVAAAGARLERVPLTIEKWQGKDISVDQRTVPEEVVGRYLVRRYVHRNSGAAVTLFLSCGPTKAMWYDHLPTGCYPRAGYKLQGSVEQYTLPTQALAGPGEMSVATFSMDETPPGVHLRLFWSWSGDGTWQVPEYPHRAFARYPFLYKAYVIRQLVKADEPLEGDPAKGFVDHLLPELKRSLFGDS